jgi:hypothetical protein
MKINDCMEYIGTQKCNRRILYQTEKGGYKMAFGAGGVVGSYGGVGAGIAIVVVIILLLIALGIVF